MLGQLVGFYVPRRKELALVTGPESLFGAAFVQRQGTERAGSMQQGTLVHELTHAVQDQHFDLAKLTADDPLSDADAARKALVEGDATLIMMADAGGIRPQDFPVIAVAFRTMLEDPTQFLALAPGVPGAADLAAAPAWIRDTLLFSYLQGAAFCASVLERGGQRLLDQAFRTDPPRSTEQILHPEKWHTQRDDPVVITWPDLTAELPGYPKAADGQLGELGIRILLQESLHDSGRVAAAAAGWGGDRFAVYRRPGSESPLLAWITEWDAEQDADRFAIAAASLGADWVTARTAARRVVVLRGAPTAGRAALTSKLAGALAAPPTNRAVDPAAIDPERRIGAPGSLTAARFAAAGQKFLNQAAPAGLLSADQSIYTNAGLGLTIRLPPLWAAAKAQLAPSPAILLSLTIPQASVVVVANDLHQSLAVEVLETFLEQGMKSSIHDFAKLDGRIVEVGGLRGYDLRFAGIAKGRKVVGSQRLLLRGSQLVMVTIVARDDSMPDIEQSAVELLAGVTLTPLSPPQAPATAAAPAPTPPALPPQAPTAAADPPRPPR